MPTSLKDFESVFPSLVRDVLADTQSHRLPQNASEWLERSFKANAIGGKCNRGLSVPDTVALLKTDESITRPGHPDFAPACELGWLIELLQAFFLVSDDIMDASVTRRGQPCWYRQPGVGMVAINDAFILESAIYVLLRAHFRTHPAYIDLVELFHDISWRTELGQSCDLLTAPEDSIDLNRFSLEKYWFIVRYKTAYYSFYLPVALALYYCQIATPNNLKQAMDILVPMGEYFQVQDDYLDNFADPETLGKIGTDILDNKCSWLINQALAIVTPEQRKVLEDNYGKKDKTCETNVKKLYLELNLQKIYADYEEKTVGDLRKMIENIDESEGLKKSVFEEFLRKIYKRSK